MPEVRGRERPRSAVPGEQQCGEGSKHAGKRQAWPVICDALYALCEFGKVA